MTTASDSIFISGAHSILDTIFDLPWYINLLALLLILKLTQIVSLWRAQRKFPAAKPAHFSTKNYFPLGLPLIYEQIKQKKAGTFLEYIRNNLFLHDNKKTVLLKRFGASVVVTKDPENIKAVLAGQFEDFCLGIRHEVFKPLLGDGIFTLDGAGWKHSRAMLRPQFTREQVDRNSMLEPHVQTLFSLIAGGRPVDIQELFFKFTVDTSTEVLFGESANCMKPVDGEIQFEGKSEFAEAFNTAQRWLSTRAVFQKLYFLCNPQSFKESTKIVHNFAKVYVDKALAMSTEELQKQNAYVFLYELVKETRDPQVLQDQLLNIMIAGRDTTAGLLSFTMYEMARNPDMWAKLRAAVGESFGLDDDARLQEMNFEELKRCVYLKWILNETLRLYPSVPNNNRTAVRDTTVPRGGGPDESEPVLVRKGDFVAYSVYSMHRDTQYWGLDANVYRPDRWENPPRVNWAYLPFNGGPRICLGQQFALTEAGYVLARLAQTFETIELFNSPQYPPLISSELTISLKEGLHLKLNKRQTPSIAKTQ